MVLLASPFVEDEMRREPFIPENRDRLERAVEVEEEKEESKKKEEPHQAASPN